MARISSDTRRPHGVTTAAVLFGSAVAIAASAAAQLISAGAAQAQDAVAGGPPPQVVQVLPTETACWQAIRRAGHQFGVTAGCRFVAGQGWVFEIW